jgi:UDP-N-acetylglucosamine--dolichyl-phosphate N-acetylglucosaminephosphotransferase
MLMENFIFLGLLFIPIVLLSFILTLSILPKWIKKAKSMKWIWEDMHKPGHPKNVAGSGGIAVLVGFVIALFAYVAIKTFLFNSTTNMIQILALSVTVIMAAAVGLIDDLFGWKKGGLSKQTRIILMFVIAIPLMAINAGESTLMGINFGLLYPLVFVPLAIVAVTTTFNFLAGFNGLEASQGMIILTALSIVNLIEGNLWLTLIGMSFVTALLAFWFFNKYPAKVFPGDVLTYATGALIATIVILGNAEKIGVFFFIPYVLEMLLKLRGKLKVQSFGALQEDGSLKLKQKGIYGLEHLAIVILRKIKPSKKAYEWEVPLVINLFQIFIVVLGFILFL